MSAAGYKYAYSDDGDAGLPPCWLGAVGPGELGETVRHARVDVVVRRHLDVLETQPSTTQANHFARHGSVAW